MSVIDIEVGWVGLDYRVWDGKQKWTYGNSNVDGGGIVCIGELGWMVLAITWDIEDQI